MLSFFTYNTRFSLFFSWIQHDMRIKLYFMAMRQAHSTMQCKWSWSCCSFRTEYAVREYCRVYGNQRNVSHQCRAVMMSTCYLLSKSEWLSKAKGELINRCVTRQAKNSGAWGEGKRLRGQIGNMLNCSLWSSPCCPHWKQNITQITRFSAVFFESVLF